MHTWKLNHVPVWYYFSDEIYTHETIRICSLNIFSFHVITKFRITHIMNRTIEFHWFISFMNVLWFFMGFDCHIFRICFNWFKRTLENHWIHTFKVYYPPLPYTPNSYSQFLEWLFPSLPYTPDSYSNPFEWSHPPNPNPLVTHSFLYLYRNVSSTQVTRTYYIPVYLTHSPPTLLWPPNSLTHQNFKSIFLTKTN